MSGLHFHPLQVRSVEVDTDDARIVQFDVPPALASTFDFAAGQYLTLRARVEGEELRRSYSICAAPGEVLQVAVRRVEGGAFSSWLHRALKAGDGIESLPPQGRFGAALAQRPRHVLAVAGGSGITPILSILQTLLARDPQAHCTLLYANRSTASMMFKEALEDLKNRHLTRLALFPVFSRETLDTPLQSGRMDADKLRTLLRLAGPVDQAFVCGPHQINDEVEAALRGAGLDPAAIHVERFGVPPAERTAALREQPGDAQQARVQIVRDGLTREVEFRPGDESILAAATRAGLDLPFACRSGVCASCRCKLLQGEVRMARQHALEPADLAAGFVLSCQAHPLTARVTLSFDER